MPPASTDAVLKRIAVDFNTLDSEPVDLVKLYHDSPPDLCPGERVLLYDEQMEVQAVASYDAGHHLWLAAPDWPTRHDLLTTAER